MAVSLLGLMPSFIWNMQHQWVTFRHVSASITGSERSTLLDSGNFFEFIGSQAALLTPILFVLLCISIFNVFKKREGQPTGLLFCCYITLLILGCATVLSLFIKVQGNWCDYAYPTAFILIAWYGCNANKIVAKKAMVIGVIFSILFSLFTLSIPFLQSKQLLNFPYKMNPFKHNLGWEKLPDTLKKAGYQPSKDFLFSSKYQMSSILSYYSHDRQRAYFLNLFGIRKNQFDFWPSMHEEQVGKDGYYVIIENQPHLAKHLANIDVVDRNTAEQILLIFDLTTKRRELPSFFWKKFNSQDYLPQNMYLRSQHGTFRQFLFST